MRIWRWVLLGALAGVALLGACGAREGEGDLSTPLAMTEEGDLATPPTMTEEGDLSTPLAMTEGAAPAETLAARLSGLEIDDFFELSWRALMLRNPEWVLSAGLAAEYGLEGAQLTDISPAYQEETLGMVQTVLDLLLAYDRENLSAEQQISYDVYAWYLEDRLRQGAFLLYDYPATYFPITAVHERVTQFFAELHPLNTPQEAADYVARLWLVQAKFEQLLEGLRLREEAGIIPPRFASQWALYGVREMAESSAQRTPYYQALAEKLSGLEGLSEGEKAALLAEAEAAIEGSVRPAFEALAVYLDHLQGISGTDEGLWQFPGGEEYYAQLLRHYTTTDLSPEAIHDLGQEELARIHSEMRAIFDALGYPQEESLAQLFDRVERDGGMVTGSQVLERYRTLIEAAEGRLDAAFDLRPRAALEVRGADYGGFYVSGSRDGSRPGVFYAGMSGPEAAYAMPTLAYHEGVPGHHFQISLAQEAELPTFRSMITFLGFAEGWALYAERLAWELDWYEGDPYGDLGRLQAEAFRAARLVIDTGIHTRGWTAGQAAAFMTEQVGFGPGDSVDPDTEVARYIVWPGQATAYKVGMVQMTALRQRAEEQLGELFDLREYHRLVLSNGSMPLAVLERLVDGYITEKLAQAAEEAFRLPELALVGGTLIDGTGAEPAPDAVLLIRL